MKKAIIFSVSIVFITLTVLFLGVTLVGKTAQQTNNSNHIGNPSNQLLETWLKSERTLTQIDILAGYALEDALLTLTQESPCGTTNYEGKKYLLWTKNRKPCLPTIDDILTPHLRKALTHHYSKHGIPLTGEDYDFFIQQKNIKGIPTKPLTFNIKNQDATTGHITRRPAFTITTEYNLPLLTTLYQNIPSITACTNEECIKQKLPKDAKLTKITDTIYGIEIEQHYRHKYTNTLFPPLRIAIQLTQQ